MKLVSACLAGIKCRFDGSAKPCEKVINLVKQGKAIPVCPEQLAGFPTPREPAENRGETVISKSGEDLTEQFLKGAEEGLRVAQLFECKEAILKSKSPSCGSGQVYDGSFSKTLRIGDGFFTQVLKKQGIKVLSEKELQ